MRNYKYLAASAAAAIVAAALPAASALAQTTAKATIKPATATSSSPIVDNTPIMTVGKVAVTFHEFEYVYKKNNANAEDAFTRKSVDEYVNLYGNFKLKVMDAERVRLDTAPSFKTELEGYRRQLAQPYLTEKAVTEQLVREAYDRMKEEVKASHILLQVDPQADPKDTLKVYTKILDLRRQALAGADFGKLAGQYSEDPSAKQNGGDLGYFSGMQMVYAFESAAYATQKGQISMPVRTRFGYHIIKVEDRRKSQGQVQVAHIMVKANPGMPAEDSLAAVKKINEIYARLQKGEKFGALAMTFSEDAGSKERGGVLPAFGSGQMIPNFEDESFALKDTGSMSKPFLTPYGWHVVKLLSRKPLESYEELEPSLKTKVGRDARAEKNRSALLARLRREDNLVEYPKVKVKAFAKADTSLLSAKWRYKRADKLNAEKLFSVMGQSYTVANFFDYIESTAAANKKSSPSYLMELAYKSYVDEQLMKYEEAHLADKYEDYRMLLKEYRDGILLFTLMDQKVWTKALDDTTGLKGFYAKNKESYRWDLRAQATIYNVADEKTLAEVKAKAAMRHYATTESATPAISFEKGSFIIEKKRLGDLRATAFNLRSGEDLQAEITGFAEKGEAGGLGRKRAKIVADSLIKYGVPAKKITVKDGGYRPISTKAKPEENRRTEFAFYSSSLKALERNMNQAAPLAVQITEGKFQKGENAVLDKLTWHVGDYTIKDDPTGKGRITYVVISSLEEPRVKTLDEARGAVISDYQNQLEKEWVDGLRKDNPVVVDQAQVAKLVRK